MGRLGLYLCCIAFVLALGSLRAFAGPETVADGLDLQQSKLSDGKTITYLRVSLTMFDVRVITPLVPVSAPLSNANSNPERMARGFFLRDYLRRFQATAVISGGYIDSYSPPTSLGFVKSNGVVASAPHISWLVEALFCSDAGRASVELMGPTADRREFRDCLQSGPLLLLNRAPPIDVPSVRGSGYGKFARLSFERTFACTDPSGRVLLGVTEKTDLQTVTEALRRPEIGCINAIGLTGSDTSGLLVNRRMFGSDDYLFPNVIAVLPRAR